MIKTTLYMETWQGQKIKEIAQINQRKKRN